MFHAIAKEFREIYRLVLGEAGGKMLRDLLRGEAKEGAAVIAERIKTLIAKNPRADLMFTLLSMEPDERDSLMAMHRTKIAEGTENAFVTTLGEALPRQEGKLDEERAKRILKALNELSEPELEQALEFLKHDPIAQWIRYWILGKGREVLVSASELAAFVAGVATPVVQHGWEHRADVVAAIDQTATTAAGGVAQFRALLNSKGVKR